MNKKLIIGLLLIGVLAFGAGIGTMAYYTQTFTSTNNTITTANFVVEEEGILSESFTVDGTFAPDDTGTANFSLDNTGSEVAMEYIMTVVTRKLTEETLDQDYLFREGTPVVLSLVKFVDGVEQVVYENIPLGEELHFPAGNGESEYGIKYSWPWVTDGVDDKAFAGDTGVIDLQVEARQLRDNIIYGRAYLERAQGIFDYETYGVPNQNMRANLAPIRIEFNYSNKQATVYHPGFVDGSYTRTIHGNGVSANAPGGIQIQVGSGWINLYNIDANLNSIAWPTNIIEAVY